MVMSHFQVATLRGVQNNGGRMHSTAIPSRTVAALVRKGCLRQEGGGWLALTERAEFGLAMHALGQEQRRTMA